MSKGGVSSSSSVSSYLLGSVRGGGKRGRFDMLMIFPHKQPNPSLFTSKKFVKYVNYSQHRSLNTSPSPSPSPFPSPFSPPASSASLTSWSGKEEEKKVFGLTERIEKGEVREKELYRLLLRTAKGFPEEKNRKGRDFRGWLLTTIKERFRDPSLSSLDPSQRRHYASLELLSLLRLQSNYFKLSYERETIVPQLVKRADKLLSNEVQEKMRKYKWGTWDRLSGLFMKDDDDNNNNNNNNSNINSNNNSNNKSNNKSPKSQ